MIAGKKCGKSVQRNRLKRITREAIRGFHPFLRQGFDIAIVCRGTVVEMPGLPKAQETLERIFTRAALLGHPRDDAFPVFGKPITSAWLLRRSSADAVSDVVSDTVSSDASEEAATRTDVESTPL